MLQIDWDLVQGAGLDEYKKTRPWYVGKIPYPMGGVVLDVGAHVGMFSLAALEQGAEMVLALEPNPSVARVLITNVAAQGLGHKVMLLTAGLGSPQGLPVALKWVGANSGMVSTQYMGGATQAQCRFVNLPSILDFVLGFGENVYCKIDIEGGEWPLLNDEAFLKAIHRVKWLELELHYNQLGSIAHSFYDEDKILPREEVIARLHKSGMNLVEDSGGQSLVFQVGE